MERKKRIIVGVTGASGSLYAYTLIRILHQLGIETHLVATETGVKVMQFECGVNIEDLKQYAIVHHNQNLFASVASGSFITDGMVIVPRSEEHTSELQSRGHLVCRLLLEKKKNI